MADYTTIPQRDLARGIDAKSPENNLPEGYCEDLINAVTNSNGQVSKRRGYELVGCTVPFRVAQAVWDSGTAANTVKLYLATNGTTDVDVSGLTGALQVVVHGKCRESGGGDFDTTSATTFYDDTTATLASDGTGPYVQITTTSAVTGTVTDTNCELAVYGVPVAARQATDVNRITHLSRYAREAEEELVCCLDGVLYVLDSSASLLGSTTAASSSGAVITVSSADNFVIGDVVSVTGYDRTFRVTGTDTSTPSITIDESISAVAGTETVAVVQRWVPVTLPSTTYDLPKTCYNQYFAQAPTSRVRGAMVNDSLFLTNYTDPVLKYDGDNVYEAGLIPWQPGMFCTLDLRANSLFPAAIPVSYTASSSNRFTCALDSTLSLSPGDRIVDSIDSTTYTVQSITSDDASNYVLVDKEIESTFTGSPTLTRVSKVRYYFRLNAIDTNNNIVASAATNTYDYTIELSSPCQVNISLTKPPLFGNRDYDRIDLEVYRTKIDSPAPFYKVTTRRVSFDSDDRYISLIDTVTDDTLFDPADLDSTMSALLGVELGTQWDSPPRAKYITSSNNRLILANIKDHKTTRINFRKKKEYPNLTWSELSTQTLAIFRDSNKSSSHSTFTAISDSSTDTFDMTSAGGHGCTGDGVAVWFHSGPTGFTSQVMYFIKVINDNEFQLCSDADCTTVVSFSTNDILIAYLCTYAPNQIVISPSIGTGNAINGPSWSFGTDEFTVTLPTGSGKVGEWVYLKYGDETGVWDLDLSGHWQISAVSGNDYTFTRSGTITTTSEDFLAADVNAGNDTIDVDTDTFPNNCSVYFSTSAGDLPDPLSASVQYYIVENDGSTIKVSTTVGGTAVDITDAGTGTHTITRNQWPDKYIMPNASSTNIAHLGTNNYGYSGTPDKITSTSADDATSMFTYAFAQTINSIMTQTDTTITGYEDFVPWIYAHAGGDYALMELNLTALNSAADSPTVCLWNSNPRLDAFIDGVTYELVDGDGSTCEIIDLTESIYPSRLVRSYANFPEIFDNPFGAGAEYSDSVIDVNAADGEEITGLAQFFGDSSFGGASLGDYVIVFKESSVYAVNVETREVKRLETFGQGCTAPDSIGPSARGIVFANRNGIYRVNRDLSVTYVGEPLERKWRSDVNTDSLSSCVGFHYDRANRYQLAVPYDSDEVNSVVFAYDHTREGKQQLLGAWARHTNHPVTAWTNFQGNGYFGTTSGEVMRYRRNGDVTDYRDDTSAISLEVLYRAMDFGDAGRRKLCRGVIHHLRDSYATTGTDLQVATDMSTSFTSAGLVTTTGTDKMVNVRHSLPTRKFNYLQVKVVNSTADEPVELAGLDFLVSGEEQFGIKEQSQTR